MGYFFISYKHDDIEFANELEEKLEEEGILTWIDRKILAGEEWKPKIDRMIREAVGVILVVSPKSLASSYVTYEWSFAKGVNNGNIKVVPLLLAGSPAAMHPKLKDIQYKDFRDNEQRPWKPLIDDLKSILAENDVSDAVKGLVRDLNHRDRTEWLKAIAALEKWQETGAVIALANAAQTHPTQEVRMHAALALAHRTENKDPRVVHGLKLAFTAVNAGLSVRQSDVVNILGELRTSEAIEILHEVLSENEDQGIRTQTANILGDIQDPSSIEPLMAALQGQRFLHLRGYAAVALAKMNVVETLPWIEKSLKEVHGYETWSIELRRQLLTAAVQLGEAGIIIAIQWINVGEPPQVLDLAVDALKTAPVELRENLMQEAIQKESDNARKQTLNIVLQKLRGQRN